MAQNTAQYEALQYSSQAPVIDFSQITKGVNEVVEKKRAEDERKAKELEAQRLQLLKDYGDEIYSDFEMTGLENVDQLGLNTKNVILEMAEETNRKLANGEISIVEASKEMMMAKNQSKKVSEFVGGLKEYAEAIRAKGPNASPSDILKLDKIDNMISNGVSVGRDGKNRLLFLSKEEGKIVANPFSKLSNYTTFSQNISPDSVVDSVMSNSKANTYLINGQSITSPLTRDNKLSDNQLSAYNTFVKDLDDEDAYDLSVNLGLKPEYDLSGELVLKNRESVNTKIVEELSKRSIEKYGTPKIDEIKGKEVQLAERRVALAEKQSKDTPESTPKFTETPTQKIYAVDVEKTKKKAVSSIIFNGQQYNNVIITGYTESKTGGADTVTISYNNQAGDELSKFDEGSGQKTETISITNPEERVFVRNTIGLDISSSNLGTTSNPGDSIFE